MKVPLYFDYVQDGSSSEKMNGVSLGTSKRYCNGFSMVDIFDLYNFDEEVDLIKEGYQGKFYYPIFWAYNDEYFSEIKIPKFVLNQIEKKLAKILIINIFEGFSIVSDVQFYITDKFGIDMDDLVFFTGNKYKLKNTKSIYCNAWEKVVVYKDNPIELYHKAYDSIFSKNNFRKHKFICLQRRPKPQRLALYTELYPYRFEGILTMGRGDFNTDTYNDFYTKDLFSGLYAPSYKKFKKNNILKTIPAEYDVNVSLKNPAFDKHIDKFFDSYLHIVSETFFENSSESIFFSEKVFKPMTYFQPFVLFNHYNSLKELKSMGYETFSEFIDESYDSIEDDNKRFYAALNSVLTFIKQNDKTLSKVMKKAFPTMSYNFFNLLASVNNTQIRVKSEMLTYLYD